MGSRPYSSSLRNEQARLTRQRIVAAVVELFMAHGYSAATIHAIAQRAGVGRKTVFSSVGGKAALLKLHSTPPSLATTNPSPSPTAPQANRRCDRKIPAVCSGRGSP